MFAAGYIATMSIAGDAWLMPLYFLFFPGSVLLLAALQHIRLEAGRNLHLFDDITYAVYLMHIPVQLVVLLAIKSGILRLDLYSPLTLALFLGAVTTIAIPTYYLFELPAQRRLRRMMLRTKPRLLIETPPEAQAAAHRR